MLYYIVMNTRKAEQVALEGEKALQLMVRHIFTEMIWYLFASAYVFVNINQFVPKLFTMLQAN